MFTLNGTIRSQKRVINCPCFSTVLSGRTEGLKGWDRRRDTANQGRVRAHTAITDTRF